MPSFYLPKIPLHDPMVDSVEDGINKLAIATDQNFNTIKRLLYGQLDTVNVRSGGIFLEDLTGGLMPQSPVNMVQGLNITAEYMGYYDGTTWTAYINDDGNFYFGGDTNNYISWNGTALSVAGILNAVTGTFETLAAGDLDSSYIALGVNEFNEPLLEMWDEDKNLRVRLEQDRMSFYTEELRDESEVVTDASVYAGMIKGLYWTTGVLEGTPEVRIEVPDYCNIIAIDSLYVGKYARSAYVNTDSIVECRLEAVNLPDSGGSAFVDEIYSRILLDQDITLLSTYGDITAAQRLVLNSESFKDHLYLSRYDSVSKDTFALNITAEVANTSISLILEEDADKFIFYAGTTPLMILYKTGGNVSALVDWASGVAYWLGRYVKRSGVGYKCTQAHTSDAAKAPGTGANWADYWVVVSNYPLLWVDGGMAVNAEYD